MPWHKFALPGLPALNRRINLLQRFKPQRQRFFPYQCHPDRRLQSLWDGIQLGVLVLPFSSLLGSVAISLIALVTCQQRLSTVIHRPLNRGLAIVACLMFLSAILAYRPVEAFLGLANFLPLFIVFAALSELIQTPAQLRRLAWMIVVSSIPVVLIGLGQHFWGIAARVQFLNLIDWDIQFTGNPPGRMSSIFFYANVLASYLVVAFILSLGLWIAPLPDTARLSAHATTPHPNFHIRFYRIFLAIAVLLNGIALILTNSRNAWAIALLGCLAYALYQGWRWLLMGVSIVASTVLGAAFAPAPVRDWLRAIVPAFFWARLTDQLYPNRPVAELRTTQWKFAWSLTQQRPWSGWGLRNFSPIYEQQMQFFVGHPHNLFLMLSAEVGLPATLLLFGFVGWIVLQSGLLLWRSRTRSRRGNDGEKRLTSESDRLIVFTYLIAFMGCTLFSLLDITLFDIRINAMGWLLLASICGITYHLPSGSPETTAD